MADHNFTAGALDRPSGSITRQWWSVVATLVLSAIFMEAVFAGAMLSGVAWARAAHSLTAVVVIALAVTTGLAALITLRRTPRGQTLGWTLLSLAAVAGLQIVVGAMSAKGANLLWLHVPLGVALVGFAGQITAGARRLGDGK